MEMGKDKLKRFSQILSFGNVIQPKINFHSEDDDLKGNWSTVFNNENPLVLELGCGAGEYTVALAKDYPNKNFIGIDIKGARFWRGAKTVAEKKIPNVAFIRAQIEMIANLFAAGEVTEIWITFPDPQIKFKRTKHRLTQPAFLSRYKHIIKPKGYIHLKTDSEFLYGYTLGLIESGWGKLDYAHHDIYHNVHAPEEATAVQTFYEKKFLDENKPITYIKFQLS